ncbi:MAG: DUF308 domain-containing protein [Actinomycetota bacterium]|nr:DUF308 domain-containing protein [Actinomycetota bacterium]
MGAGRGDRSGREEPDFLEAVGRSWGWVLFFGAVTLVVGILVVSRPVDTVFGVALFIGIWLFVSGLFRVVLAIADGGDDAGNRILIALLGLLSVIIGLFLIRRTFETVATLAVLLGIFWVVGGLIEFVEAYSRKGAPGRVIRIVMGLLGFAAGVVTLFIPGLTLVVLATVMGIWLIFYGVLQVFAAFAIRKLTH